MALYKYSKNPVKVKPQPTVYEEQYYTEPEEDDVIIIKRNDNKKLTLWDIIFGIFGDINHLIVSSKIAGIIIPLVLVSVGVGIVFNQLWPEFEQFVKYSTGYYDSYNTPLVEGDYVARAEYLSNPGAEYFKELSGDAREAAVLQPDPISNSYKGRFNLSIPSLGLNSLPVQANVDSGVKEAYNTILNSGLAHFEGTGLPISDIDNNIVIYGHSSSNDYYERTGDVAAAFSRLNQIKIGDEITLEINGEIHVYRVIKSKIVEPNDISIITGTPNQETLTLFTCFPNGNFSKRFVTIAKPIT